MPGFLSARPVRAATCFVNNNLKLKTVSIRATRAGRDVYHVSEAEILTWFLSARPVRAATVNAAAAVGAVPRFYPRDPCGPRPPLEGRILPRRCCFYPRDPCGPRRGSSGQGRSVQPVSIRATRAGRDKGRVMLPNESYMFLSARPVRAATSPRCWRRHLAMMFLSARPVRAATEVLRTELIQALVSIRATRAGRDVTSPAGARSARLFLSARPVRAATHALRPAPHPSPVSIRATRAGRDQFEPVHSAGGWRFYPRDPCGPRPLVERRFHRGNGFYPRDPCGPRRWTARALRH